MTDLVTFDPVDKTYSLYIHEDGEPLPVGLSQDDLCGPIAVLKAIDWLRTYPWFTLGHVSGLFELTRLHAKWPVWREQED